MLSTSHQDLKANIIVACLEIFPEAKCVLLWGGSLTSDFSPAVNDVDVIIEIDLDFSQEVLLAERLKSLIVLTSFCKLDPFVYLTEGKADEPLEFIAPFGFYKANPFIPYLIQQQHQVIYGQSRLLEKLPPGSLAAALSGIMPAAMGALKRLRMDMQSEGSWTPLAAKHKASLFVVTRTYFAFEQGAIGSKKESLRFLARKFPRFQSVVDQLWMTLEPESKTPDQEPAVEIVLDFVKTLEQYFVSKR